MPKELPWQVYLLVPPQVPSVETLPVGEGAADDVFVEEIADEDLTVEEDTGVLDGLTEELLGLLLPQFPKPDWQPLPQ